MYIFEFLLCESNKKFIDWMRKNNNSYFNRHKESLKNNKSIKVQITNPRDNDIKVNQFIADKNAASQKLLDLPSHSFIEEKSEEQKVYEEYKEIEAKYNRELAQLEQEICKIKKQNESELKKIHQAENSLQTKKKQLKAAKQHYHEMCKAVQTQQTVELSEAKIIKLEQEITKLSEDNLIKIKVLNQQEQKAKEENNELKQKLADLQKEYKKHLQFDYNEFQEQKKSLQAQQQQLKKQLEQIQEESKKIKKDIDKIQNMKPVSGEVHKKYLDLFEKIFISQEIGKAERIMSLKEEQRKQTIQVNRRKQWLREKQQEINMRERRVIEKDHLIQKLTNQIREKSTLLLNKYHVDNQKQKR